MTSITPTTVPTKRLAASLTTTSMAMSLNNIRGWDGVALTSADFGTRAYGVFRDAQGTVMEIFEWDPSTIADASITILKRGLKFNGDLTTEVTANKLVWVRNDTLVELGSDVPQLLNHMVRIIDSPDIVDQLKYATELTPTDRADIPTKGYVDDLVNGGTVSLNRMAEAGNAGETVAIRELLYLDQTDDEWKKTDADTIATLHNVRLAIAAGSGTNGNAITGGVITKGLISGFSGLTAGDSYYASNTAGAITNSPGTIRRKIGVAKSTTELYFDPEIEKMTYDEVRRLLGIYALDTSFSDAYAIAPSPAATQYTTGMIIAFKPLNNNTGPCSINVNSLGAKTIKKVGGTVDLVTGDILAGQTVFLVYDGTNFQLMSPPAKTMFGGDGSDGALSISSGTTTLDAAGAKVLTKNYTSISITGTAKLTIQNPHASGTILILKSMGNVTITSTQPGIDLQGMGGTGGTAGVAGTVAAGILFSADTPNGKAGSSGTGGAGGGAVSNSEFYTNTEDKLHRHVINVVPGSGGAGGIDGFAANAGTGGRGGGALIIECGGALNFTGSIRTSGANGTAGGTSSRSGSGGGGGGSAGMYVILYNILTAASGTVTSAGGDGGAGGTEAGSATSATGGGGGGGGGSLGVAGGNGGDSQAAGGSPAALSGAGGGGGGGGSSDGGAANGGGAGGTGGTSMVGIIAQNKYFA